MEVNTAPARSINRISQQMIKINKNGGCHNEKCPHPHFPEEKIGDQERNEKMQDQMEITEFKG